MTEPLVLQLLQMAERWADAAGTTLRFRKHFKPTVFSVTRRPEERALLAAAVELHDLISAVPEAAHVMRSMGMEPDAGALQEEHDLVELWSVWKASREIHGQPQHADGSEG